MKKFLEWINVEKRFFFFKTNLYLLPYHVFVIICHRRLLVNDNLNKLLLLLYPCTIRFLFRYVIDL